MAESVTASPDTHIHRNSTASQCATGTMISALPDAVMLSARLVARPADIEKHVGHMFQIEWSKSLICY